MKYSIITEYLSKIYFHFRFWLKGTEINYLRRNGLFQDTVPQKEKKLLKQNFFII